MAAGIRLAVVSDLHFRELGGGKGCLPAVATAGTGYDPVSKFLDLIKQRGLSAHYVLCPGDITDKASPAAFHEGWRRLREIKEALGARHLIASTGNHEVDSRVLDPIHDRHGNSELELDPVGLLQAVDDYPSSLWNGPDRKWVYWGRGYEFIRDGSMLFLLINSSHFHATTRANEFERGRIGTTSLTALRAEIHLAVADPALKGFVAVLHHPPVNHESLDFSLGRIGMFNGAGLVEVLAESGRAWLVVHGHKHHGRMVLAQGSGYQPIVMAAASAGANLTASEHGLHARLQAYILELELPDNPAVDGARGTVEAFSWIEQQWVEATSSTKGIPNGSGFASPPVDPRALAKNVKEHMASHSLSFAKWPELVDAVPDLRHLMPGQLPQLKTICEALGAKFTWPAEFAFPEDITFGSEAPCQS